MIEDGTSSGDDENNFTIDWIGATERGGHHGPHLSPSNNGTQKRSNSRRTKPTIEHLTDEERKIRLDKLKCNIFGEIMKNVSGFLC